jgi:hypothetical protein
MKLDGSVFTSGFLINDKPDLFEGKVDQKRPEGRYSGQGRTVRCDARSRELVLRALKRRQRRLAPRDPGSIASYTLITT